MSVKRVVWTAIAGLFAAAVLVQGFRHHFRLSPTMPTMDCRTHEFIDDGCSMLGSCFKCEPRCPEPAEPVLVAVRGCS